MEEVVARKICWLACAGVCLNAFAIDFKVSPYISYDDMRDDFVRTDLSSLFKVKRTGAVFGTEFAANSPIVRLNIRNNLKAGFGYGVVDATSLSTTSTTSKTAINTKTWKMQLEDTVSYSTKVFSRTSPYIGAGYSFDKYRIDHDQTSFYGANYSANAQLDNGKLQGTNKRFYVPIGFKVKATDTFAIDVRYEKDMLKKLNKSTAYFKDKSASTPREFEKGNGIALQLDWFFTPRQNTGISAKVMRHSVDFKGAFDDGSNIAKQKQSENTFLVQFHWLGNN